MAKKIAQASAERIFYKRNKLKDEVETLRAREELKKMQARHKESHRHNFSISDNN